MTIQNGTYSDVKQCVCGYTSNGVKDWKEHKNKCTGEPLYIQLRKKELDNTH